MLSEVFWVAFISTISAMIIKCGAMAYKSKCKEVHLCCLSIIRDLEAEERAEALEYQNNQNNTNNNNNNNYSQSSNRSPGPSSPRFSML